MGTNLSVNLNLDVLPITTDKNNATDILRLYQAVKIVAEALDLYTGELIPPVPAGSTAAVFGYTYCRLHKIARVYKTAAVNLSAGKLVGLDTNGNLVLGTAGTVVGFVPSAALAGAVCEVILLGLCTNFTGFTPGTSYYATSNGDITATATVQKIGFALDSSTLFVNPN